MFDIVLLLSFWEIFSASGAAASSLAWTREAAARDAIAMAESDFLFIKSLFVIIKEAQSCGFAYKKTRVNRGTF